MNFKQWTVVGDNYFPAGDVVKTLPTGYYDVIRDMSGTYFKKNKLRTESLIELQDDASKSVIAEINRFWTLEKKFVESGTPYKRGILLYGPPGSGKTCTLRRTVNNMIESHNGLVINWDSLNSTKAGYELVRTVHKDTPIVFLMEDIDSILRHCCESDLLNYLDGMHDIHKVIFLATTNYPEQLSSRLANRPSRFDKKIFIGMPSLESRQAYLKAKKDLTEQEVTTWAKDTSGMSFAHLKELYVATKILGDSYSDALSVLKNMKIGAHSSSYDDYRVQSIRGESKNKVRLESKDKKLKLSEFKRRELNENKYNKYGTGNVYKALKAKHDPIAMIAESISDDCPSIF